MVTDKGLKKDPELPDKINKAVFPGLQGGPHDNPTAGISIALFEAAQPSFKKYAAQIVKNSKALAKTLIGGGLDLVGGGSENHLILVSLPQVLGPGGDLCPKGFGSGRTDFKQKHRPDEPSSAFYPSGIRLGTPASTTRGMKEKEMKFIGNKILEVLEVVKDYRLPQDKTKRKDYLAGFQKFIEKSSELKKNPR